MYLQIKYRQVPDHSQNTHSTFHTSFIANCLLIAVCFLLTLTGCDQTFQPLQKNDETPFSIYGYLDASADTQWVRVTPIRDQLNQPPVKPEMQLTLEHIESGNTSALHDSLFLFPDGFHIINAWTDMDLEPGQHYRLRAERPDGTVSGVTVALPDEFPAPRLQITEGASFANLYIEGVDRLVDVQTRTRARILALESGWDFVGVYTISHNLIRKTAPRKYNVQLYKSRVLNYVRGQIPAPPRGELEIIPLRRQIFVASGGPEWNENLASLNDLEYSLPDNVSNVENGVGYLFGIVSKSIPFKSCFNDQGELIACSEEQPL